MLKRTIKSKGNVLAGIALCLALFGGLVSLQGYKKTWEIWNIPVSTLSFFDLRVITAGAKTYAEGHDPMLDNPYDISGRKLNYPRIWQALYPLGLGADDAGWLGVLSDALFLAGVVVAMPPLRNVGVAWLLAALVSPAVMLALERGNTDLLVFFLLALALVIRRTGWSLAVILFAFVLKLFPLVAVIMVLGRKRSTAGKVFLFAAGFALLYLLFSLNDLLLIGANTPSDTWLSYGHNVLWMKVSETSPVAGSALRFGTHAVMAGGLLAAGLVWLRRSSRGKVQEGLPLDAFRVGAACYVGTFLLGNNFNYRLMFLLFTLPQLLAWAANGEARCVARVALAGIYFSLWSMVVDRWLQGLPGGVWCGLAVSEAAHWAAFGALLHLLCRTLPGWTVAWVRGGESRARLDGPRGEPEPNGV